MERCLANTYKKAFGSHFISKRIFLLPLPELILLELFVYVVMWI